MQRCKHNEVLKKRVEEGGRECARGSFVRRRVESRGGRAEDLPRRSDDRDDDDRRGRIAKEERKAGIAQLVSRPSFPPPSPPASSRRTFLRVKSCGGNKRRTGEGKCKYERVTGHSFIERRPASSIRERAGGMVKSNEGGMGKDMVAKRRRKEGVVKRKGGPREG
ncbi:hypothetical protein BJY59DRAFT_48050 [Rhodotorula toruloides]